MTGSGLLTVLKNQIAAALPTWTVLDTPASDPVDKQVAMNLGPASVGGYQFGGLEIKESVHVFATISTAGGAVAAYHTIADTRDAIAGALLDSAFISSLQLSGVLLFEDGAPNFDEPSVTKDSASNGFWMVELVIPVKRSI